MTPIDLSIAAELKAIVPTVAVGRLAAVVRNSAHDETLWREIETAVARFRGAAMEDVRRLPPIKALRDAYRTLGNDPTRYRGSNEALVRRITQGKDLHGVNTLVDVNNLVSLETLHSAGMFDLELVEPPITFRVGQPGESYAGIGRGEIKIERLPVFADRRGPFGSTTSDSERAMIRLESTRIMMVIISFMGPEVLASALTRASTLLTRFAAASRIETAVVV